MNKNYDDEYELDLFLLFSYLLKKWKIMIISGVVCTIIVAGYSIIARMFAPVSTEGNNKFSLEEESYKKKVQEYDDYISEIESVLNSYMDQKARAESNRSYLQEILEEVNREQEVHDAFKKNSKLFKIDPHNIYKGTQTYYVSNDYQLMPGMSYQNPNPLNDIINTYVMYGNMANANENETLGELSLCSVSAIGNNLIVINAIGSDEKQVQQYVEKAGEAIRNAFDTVAREIGEHTIVLLETRYYNTFDSNLETAQKEYDEPIKNRLDIIDKINSLNNQINGLYTNISNVTKTIRDTEEAKSNLKKPEEEKIIDEVKGMSLIKSAVIGFIIGIIICAVFFVFRYVTIGTIKSSNELERRYGISVLGSIKDDLRLSVAIATIRNLLENNDSLIIVSSVGREACERFAEKIKEKYPPISISVAGDIANDIDGVALLKGIGKVVIIEEVNESKVSNISHEVEIIRVLGSDIVGFVVA